MYLQRYHLRTRPLKWYVLTYFNPGKSLKLTSMYEIDLDKRKFHVHFMNLSCKVCSAVFAKKGYCRTENLEFVHMVSGGL